MAIPPAKSGTAQPPVFGVPKTSEWRAERQQRPLPWWRRLFARQPS